MEVDRIPLGVIEEAFFGNQIDEGIVHKGHTTSELDVSASGEMNDYTVIRLGDKPKPVPETIAKYPKFERIPIKSEIPSVFYSIKVRPQPEPEYVPPPRPHPRDVNCDVLSASQKEMYGKSPYQQDLIIIKKKRELLAQNGPAPDPNTIPPREGVKVPEIYTRFEKEWTVEKAKRDAAIKAREEQQRKAEEEARKESIEHAAKQREIRQLRQMERELERQKEQVERAEMEKAKLREWKEKAANWNPNRPTRASRLKDDSCRRQLEMRELEEKRLALSRELRREKDKKEAIKLKPVLERLKPLGEGKGTAEKMRKEMRANQRKWVRWLKLTEDENEQKQPMLERLFADDHIAEMGDSGDRTGSGKVDANMVEYE